MPIEHMRQEPPDEEEIYHCILCCDDFEFTGTDVQLNDKIVCDGCACEVASQAGYFDRMLKAERENKMIRKELSNLPCDCNAQHAVMATIAHSEFCPQGVGEYVLFSFRAKA